MMFDVYERLKLLGTIGIKDGKLYISGPEANFLRSLAADIGQDPDKVLAEFQRRFRGQALFLRPHGASPYLYRFREKPKKAETSRKGRKRH